MIKRSIILINKPFQYRYAGVTIISFLMCIGVIWFCYWLFQRSDPGFVIDQDLEVAIHTFVKYMTLRLGIFAFLVAIFAIYISHKVAGPLYRFQKSLESVIKGDLSTRIGLRKGDELNELKDALNQMIASIHAKIQQDKDRISRLLPMLIEMRDKLLGSPNPEVLATVSKQCETIEKELHEIRGRFKT